ncbi:MAG: sulfatase-like hydrolase/transferase [Opitutales bacterium]
MNIKKLIGKVALLGLACLAVSNTFAEEAKRKPNVILMLADDLGYGDTGFNGNTLIKTPNLDALAGDGSVLRHFYSIGPVCSPTRGAYLTGRHYYRFGVFYANQGHLPAQEYTIAKMLKEAGYTTGHFGKWHLGTVNAEHSSKGAGRKPKENFSPPWLRDYDESFVTESAVSTWDPAKNMARYKLNEYYHNGVIETENLDGCDSRVIMDRVIPFIEKAVAEKKPFLSVIWFHASHAPTVAGPQYLAMYPDTGAAGHFYGCITAMDDQVGRLREKLKELGQDDNTFIFFTSDNGPEGANTPEVANAKTKSALAGTTGGFTGRKRSINDGGVRVPTFVYYPASIKGGEINNVPMSTLDLLPTVAKVTGAKINSKLILDGQDFMPIVTGKETTHSRSIPFRSDSYACLVKGKYKLIIKSMDDTSEDKLHNLDEDKTEEVNVISQHPEMAAEMRKEIMDFLASAEKSHAGEEYDTPYTPTNNWQVLGAKKVMGDVKQTKAKKTTAKKKKAE